MLINLKAILCRSKVGHRGDLMLEEDDDEKLVTFKAMNLARSAFEKYLSDQGYDPAYWAIRLTVWQLASTTFQPLEKMEIDTREGKE